MDKRDIKLMAKGHGDDFSIIMAKILLDIYNEIDVTEAVLKTTPKYDGNRDKIRCYKQINKSLAYTNIKRILER